MGARCILSPRMLCLSLSVMLACAPAQKSNINDTHRVHSIAPQDQSDGVSSVQSLGSTIIGDPASLAYFMSLQGSHMSQFLGTRFVILPKPISTDDLAEAIVEDPAWRKQIESAIEQAAKRENHHENE